MPLEGNYPTILVYARAQKLGILPQNFQQKAIQYLTNAAFNDSDLSFIDDELILALLTPYELIKLGFKIRGTALPSLSIRITEIVDDEIDLDCDPESHFEIILNSIQQLDQFDLDTDAIELIQNARNEIDYSIQIISDRKRDYDRNRIDEDDDYWENIAVQKPNSTQQSDRSIFDDVDE